jgi:hypothetical protein
MNRNVSSSQSIPYFNNNNTNGRSENFALFHEYHAQF